MMDPDRNYIFKDKEGTHLFIAFLTVGEESFYALEMQSISLGWIDILSVYLRDSVGRSHGC